MAIIQGYHIGHLQGPNCESKGRQVNMFDDAQIARIQKAKQQRRREDGDSRRSYRRSAQR